MERVRRNCFDPGLCFFVDYMFMHRLYSVWCVEFNYASVQCRLISVQMYRVQDLTKIRPVELCKKIVTFLHCRLFFAQIYA